MCSDPFRKKHKEVWQKKSEMQCICIRVLRQRWEGSVSVCSFLWNDRSMQIGIVLQSCCFSLQRIFTLEKKSWVIKRTLSSILLTSSCCLSFYKEFKCIIMFANNSYFITNNTHRMIYLSEYRSSARRDFKMRMSCI